MKKRKKFKPKSPMKVILNNFAEESNEQTTSINFRTSCLYNEVHSSVAQTIVKYWCLYTAFGTAICYIYSLAHKLRSTGGSAFRTLQPVSGGKIIRKYLNSKLFIDT